MLIDLKNLDVEAAVLPHSTAFLQLEESMEWVNMEALAGAKMCEHRLYSIVCESK